MQTPQRPTVSIVRGDGPASRPVGQEEPLATVRISEVHSNCRLPLREQRPRYRLFANEALLLVPGNYCRIFVLPSPDDPAQILGYDTFSASLLLNEQLSGSDEKRAIRTYRGIPPPMVLSGLWAAMMVPRAGSAPH